MTNQNVVIASEKEPYYYGLDIIRIIAMFLVITVHATTFYGFSLNAKSSIVDALVGAGRYISFACIPLFIILTGYLNSNKEPSWKYFKKIFNFLIEYLLCALIIWGFRALVLKETFTVVGVFTKLFNFSLAPYAWYINMFIGLFLITPFLNILYKNIKTQNQKKVLIVVLLFILSVPATFKKFAWNYWNVAYPLLFYFIGLYIKEYQPKFNKAVLILIVVGVALIEVLIKMYLSSPLYIAVESHNNLFCVILSTALFLIFYDLHKEQLSNKSGLLRGVANLSLSTFLISYIFEALNSVLFNSAGLNTFAQRLPHLLYLTPVKFLLSVCVAFLIHNLCKLLLWAIDCLIKKCKANKEEKTPV